MGDYTVGETLYFMFTTRSFSTGAPTQLAGTPVVSAYEDDSLTQITAGITLGVNHDSVTGLNLLTIVGTGANGYEAGKQYNLVITTGTVGGVSVVGEVVGVFSLGAEAAFTRLGAPAGASVSADIAAVQADTDNLQTRTPAALVGGRMDSSVGAMAADVVTAAAIAAGAIDAATFAAGAIDAAAMNVTGSELTAIPWNAAWDAEVQSEVEDALDVTIADSVPADGTRPSVRQALLQISRMLMEFGIVGTTMTVYKEDGTTASMTLTLNDGTNPTALTRAT